MRSVRIQSSACGSAVDHLYTQVFPTKILGTKHVLMPFSNQSKGYMFRVVATKPNTKISIDGTYIGSTRGAGTYYSQDVTSAVARCVTADSPIYVVQYMKNGPFGFYNCSGNTSGEGDPAILIMPDQNQKMIKTIVGTATTKNMKSHYVNILVPTSAKKIVKLKLLNMMEHLMTNWLLNIILIAFQLFTFSRMVFQQFIQVNSIKLQ